MNHFKAFLLLSLFLMLSACSSVGSNSNIAIKKSLPVGFASHGVKTVKALDGEPVRTGDSSFRFEVRDGDCSRTDGWNDCKNDRQRHEYKSGNLAGELWFNWSLYIPANFQSIYPATVTLAQFHQHNGSGPPFMFQTSANHTGQKNGYNIDRQVRGSTRENKPLLTDSEMRGRWVDVLVHVNWKSDYRGLFRIYVNGETVPRYQYVGPTIDKRGGSPYFKFGIYQSHISRYLRMEGKGAKTPTQVVYFDDVRRGSSCEGAAVYFDCSTIESKQHMLKQPVPPPEYERSKKGLQQRFACWEDDASVQLSENLPSKKNIQNLIQDLKNRDYRVSHFLISSFLGRDVMAVHKTELVNLINFVGTSDEYCSSL